MNIVVTILLLLQLPSATAGQTGAIVGQIRTGNGAPAREVRVAASPAQDGNTPEGSRTLVSIGQTDSEGRFRLENVPPGNYYVLAGLLDRPTYYPAAAQPATATVVRVIPGTITQGVDFALIRSAGVGVSGRVVRADGSTTTRQSLFINSNTSGAYMPTNIEAGPDGSFAFNRVPPGDYTITLSPGFPGSKPLRITVDETDIAGLEFFVPRIREVSGEIVVPDGSPLPRLSLSFTSSDATIPMGLGGAGSALRLSLPEGDYRIGISGFPFGYTVESVTHGSTDLSRSMLRVGATNVSGIRIAFRAPPAEAWLKVRGRVERPSGSGPAPNKVVLRGSQVLQDIEASVGADGAFEFPKVLPGSYNVQAQAVSGIPISVTVNVNRDIDDLKVVLPRQIEVTGRVTVEGGAPVPFVYLSANGKDGVTSASMENGGRFRFILREGDHRIAVSNLPTGYALKSITHGATDLQLESLRLSGPDAAEVLVTLAPSSPNLWRRVSGKVTAAAGSVTLNTLRVGLNGSGLNHDVPVRDDGAFEFSKLPPGSYTVRLNPGNGLAPTTITVADKDVGGIVLAIPNRVPVAGRITMEGGLPLPRASIVVDNETSINLGTLQPDGTFTVRLAEGEHRLSIVPNSNAYRVKSAMLGTVDLLRRPAVINSADQQLSVEFQAENLDLWRKVSGGLRRSPDAALPSNRILLGGPAIQSFDVALGADGSFEVPKLAAGTYLAFLQPVGLYSPSAEFVVGESDVTGIELVSPEAIRVPVSVSIENGGAAPTRNTVLRAETARPIRGLMGMVESVGDEEDLALILLAGEFRVKTIRLPAGFMVRSMTYGATDAINAPLRVDGPTNTRLEIVLRRVDPASISGVRVSGRVKMPPAEGTPRPTTVAFSATQSGGQTYETPITDDDSFLFPRIPPGTYDSRLIGPNIPPSIQQYRKQVVVPDKDQDGVELTAVIWAHVRGRVVLDGPGTLPDFRRLNLGVQFRQGSFAIGDAVRPDGSFEMALVRGDFQVALDIPEAYYIKSISSRGADLIQGRFTHDANGAREILITLGSRTVPPR